MAAPSRRYLERSAPLLPIFDHLIATLVMDLEERGFRGDTLVIAMGKLGRTLALGNQGSTDGRSHWFFVSSILMVEWRLPAWASHQCHFQRRR
ncbi:MAG: hypothetical protein M2R45_04349 [Verrucomicrobia subdivision 3 bacterium]|nr:hypothetical protein [Limisphaerales bacterium]MCS1416053.1 hypothetical protein [Limisphaerales bacterium]